MRDKKVVQNRDIGVGRVWRQATGVALFSPILA